MEARPDVPSMGSPGIVCLSGRCMYVCVCRVCIKRLWLVRAFTVSSLEVASRSVPCARLYPHRLPLTNSEGRPPRSRPRTLSETHGAVDDVAAAGWAPLSSRSPTAGLPPAI
jgi:hypothetical protein